MSRPPGESGIIVEDADGFEPAVNKAL